MKFTFNWLKRHLETNLSAKEIANHLTKLGFEIENFKSPPSCWQQIEIVKIIEKEKHPNADRLNLYTILLKNNDTFKIVCGDSSLEVGNFVPFAKVGTKLPNEVVIKKAKIREVESNGMLCSAKEIDLFESDGVLKCFEQDFGKTMQDAYESEAIIEISVLPNKPEGLSIRGIARALSFEDLGTLKPLEKFVFEKIEVQDFFELKTIDCSSIQCCLINYKCKKTNFEIAKLLTLTDNKVTNLDIVDYTNFISMDIGQPMHAFDWDKISKINIINLENQEEFISLKNEPILLEKGTLVFKDSSNKIISWPGVIGGNDSKIKEKTETILLETGIFQIDSIQRRKNKIITTASKRFEYGVDYENVEIAIELMLNLIGYEKNVKVQTKKFELTKKIKFDFEKIEKISGLKVEKQEIINYLEKKGFKFDNDFVIPPSYKFFDIKTQNCIVEEFIINKLDLIESINLPPKYGKQVEVELSDLLKTTAIENGFNECYNITLVKKENEFFESSDKNRKINNAANLNYSYLRSNLIVGLLKNFEWHIKNNHKTNLFFEIGLIYGEFQVEQTQKENFCAISDNYEDLNKLIHKIIKKFNIKFEFAEEKINYLDSSITFKNNGATFAKLGLIKNEITKEFDIKECFSLEIYLENLKINENKKQEIAISPVYKEITFKLKENETTTMLINFLNKENYEFKIMYIYPNKELNQARNITLQFKFQEDETMKKDEIIEKIEKIKKDVYQKLKIES